jgi:hypothetical protein
MATPRYIVSIFSSELECTSEEFANINDAAVRFYELDASLPEDQFLMLERCATVSVCSKNEQREEEGD